MYFYVRMKSKYHDKNTGSLNRRNLYVNLCIILGFMFFIYVTPYSLEHPPFHWRPGHFSLWSNNLKVCDLMTRPNKFR